MNEALRNELERMREADQAIRGEAMEIARTHGLDSPEYAEIRARGKAMQDEHTARLVEILEEHGWPVVSEVGEAAAGGAFLLLQHADHYTQKRFLPLLREATAAGEAKPTDLPLLEDRIRMQEGRPQRYGSQLTRGADGKPTLWPIEDEAHVDERRAAVGLEPLEDYLRRFGIRQRPNAEESA